MKKIYEYDDPCTDFKTGIIAVLKHAMEELQASEIFDLYSFSVSIIGYNRDAKPKDKVVEIVNKREKL